MNVTTLYPDAPPAVWVEAICSYCPAIFEIPAVVAYGEGLFCGPHAASELGDEPAAVYREAWC